MATYAVGGNQGTESSSYKGCMALWAPATTPRRVKLYEYKVGATGNPNATDTYIQFDISRITGTTTLAGSAFTPNPTDFNDQASITLAAVNITAEVAAALLTVSLDNYGINQRSTVRWIAAQESQYLISPATNGSGLYSRSLSNAYTGAVAVQGTFLE
jgi:hypothetical protein